MVTRGVFRCGSLILFLFIFWYALLYSHELYAGGFIYPVGNTSIMPGQPGNSYEVTQGYRYSTNHTGVDLANGYSGGQVYAVAKGSVVARNNDNCEYVSDGCRTWGNLLRIRHDLPGGTVYSQYAHMLAGSLSVNVGDPVIKGQVIGRVGNTGYSTGNHLHFEIKYINTNGCGYIPSSNCPSASWDDYENPLNFIALNFEPLPPRFSINDRVQVTSDIGLKVRATPGGNKLGSETFGSTGKIIDGPKGAPYGGLYYTWWKIQWDDGQSGWSAEGYGGVYWLEPVSDNPPMVNSFDVTPKTITQGSSLIISYSVSDDIGLKQVELWRATDTNGDGQPNWPPGQNDYEDIQLLSGQTSSGSFTDVPSIPGTYWYGIHVLDNVNSYVVEPDPPGPIMVTVLPRDTTPPTGTVSINNNATYTKITSVTLTINSPDPDVSQMCISNTTSCSSWVNYATTKSWTLPSGDGTKTVYIWFKDSSGNPNSSPADSDSIILDTTPPSINSFTATAGDSQVSLIWSGSDTTSGINNYKLVYSTSAAPTSCNTGTPIYSGTGTSKTHASLTNGMTYYYRLCATDNAGNSSSQARSATPSPGTISIVFYSTPSGRQIIKDGNPYNTPVSFDWRPGSNHTIEAPSPQSGGTGTRYIFTSWSDGGARSHSVSPSSATTFTASFKTQYLLTTAVSPSGAGTISPDCSNGCWHDGGTQIPLSATSNGGYTFSSWSGDINNTSNNISITMDGPKSITANFSAPPTPTVSWNTASQTVSEGVGSVSLTAGLSATTDQTVIIPYTVSGTATGGGVDHDLANGSITIPAGQSSRSVNFNIIDDSIVDSDETIIIIMGTPTNATAGSVTTHTVTIIDNDIAPEPDIAINPTSHNYGDVQVGSSSQLQTFTITNQGTADLTLEIITIAGTDDSEFNKKNDNCSGQTVAPSDTCTFDASFSPTSTGAKTANLSIPSNDPDTPTLNVSLSGTGTEVVVETVSAPNQPTGPSILIVNQSGGFSTGGSTSSFGDPVEYEFDWGNGPSGVWGNVIQSHIWSAQGTYSVKARARCATHSNIVSGWSSSLSITIQPITTYTLDVSKSGSGTVTSSPSGISCGSDCSESYQNGTQITLTAIPENGEGVSWSGCDNSSGNTCDVTMNSDKNITVTFIQPSIDSDGDGMPDGLEALMGYDPTVADVPPTLAWFKTYGGTADENAHSVQQTTDGGYVIVGNTGNDPHVYLVKTDSSGNELWSKTLSGGTAVSVQQTTDGGYIIAGDTGDIGNNNHDIFLIKTDSSGNVVWYKTFGGSTLDAPWAMQQTPDGGYIIAGDTDSFGAGSYDVYLVKTDSSGNELWSKTFGGASYDSGRAMDQTTDGGYIITGLTKINDLDDVYLIKTDSSGNEIWSKTFGGANIDIGESVRQTSDGGYIIAGYTESYGTGGDIYLIKTDSSGNELWSKAIGGTESDDAFMVQQTSDGGYIITGPTSSYGAGGVDVYLVKTDSSGNEVWSKTFGGASRELGFWIQQTSDGGYIVTGSTDSYGSGGRDILLIKYDLYDPAVADSDSDGMPDGWEFANGLDPTTNDSALDLDNDGLTNIQEYQNGTDPQVANDIVVAWKKTYGGSSDDVANTVSQTSDGGYIVAGSRNSTGVHSGTDTYLVKTDSQGNLEWDKTIVGSSGDWANYITQTDDGGYIVAGTTNSPYDVYLMKLDSNRNIVWNKTFGGSGWDGGRSAQQTSDGGYIIAGSWNSDTDIYLIKTDSSGNLEWEKTIDGGLGVMDYTYSVQQTTDDGYIITGQIKISSINDDIFLLKTDASGNVTWTRYFGGNFVDSAYEVQQTADGGYILAGRTEIDGSGNYDVYLIKTDSSGNLVWEKTYANGDGYTAADAMTQTSDGGYILAGPSETSNGSGNWDLFIIKTDSLGNQQWERILGGLGDRDWANSIQQTTDGGYIVAGATNTYGAGLRDFWLIKLMPAVGCLQGDINNDNLVNIQDIVKFLRIITGLDPAPTTNTECIDLNGNSQIDILDAIKALRITLGLN